MPFEKAQDQWWRLDEALQTLAGWGWQTPCQADPEPFTEGAPRALAARAQQLCLTRCAVVDECRAYAEAANERFHVWGGVNRGSKTAPVEAD